MAVLETLISARIADNMTGTRHRASDETRGLGFANMLSGALGNMPCTGVLIRTSVNCQSGATHKASQFINALWVLAMILVLLPAFSWIPMSVIASILITSSCRLIPKRFIAQTFVADKFECALIFITWAGCVFIDGALGLIIGCSIALVRETQFKCDENAWNIECEEVASLASPGRYYLVVRGTLNYLTCVEFEDHISGHIEKHELGAGDHPDELTVQLCALDVVDFDGLASIRTLRKRYDGKVNLSFVADAETLTGRCNAIKNQLVFGADSKVDFASEKEEATADA